MLEQTVMPTTVEVEHLTNALQEVEDVAKSINNLTYDIDTRLLMPGEQTPGSGEEAMGETIVVNPTPLFEGIRKRLSELCITLAQSERRLERIARETSTVRPETP